MSWKEKRNEIVRRRKRRRSKEDEVAVVIVAEALANPESVLITMTTFISRGVT